MKMTPHFSHLKAFIAKSMGRCAAKLWWFSFLLPWLDSREQRKFYYSEKMQRDDGDCRPSVAEIQKYAQKYRLAGWGLFIKRAGNSQRSALSFAGKCWLVRRGGEWAAGNDENALIRFKYEYKYTKYTQKDKIYTNTKIQTRTNTNFAIGTLSQIRGGGILDLSGKRP